MGVGVQNAFCDGVCMEHFALSVIRISTVIAKSNILFFCFLKDILTAPLYTFVFVLFFALRMEDDNYDNSHPNFFCVCKTGQQGWDGEIQCTLKHSKNQKTKNKLKGIVCKKHWLKISQDPHEINKWRYQFNLLEHKFLECELLDRRVKIFSIGAAETLYPETRAVQL